jgi:hypothetical protein
MMQEQFSRLLKRFAGSPVTSTTGRHVYLWHGNDSHLSDIVPAEVKEVLDLHTLVASASRTPYEQADAARVIQKLIEAWLEKNLAETRQRIVIISGCDILARYRVPLTAYFQWVSDTTMFIFVVEDWTSLSLAGHIPEYVSLNTQSVFTYLHEIMSESATIEGEGNHVNATH